VCIIWQRSLAYNDRFLAGLAQLIAVTDVMEAKHVTQLQCGAEVLLWRVSNSNAMAAAACCCEWDICV